MVVERAKQLTTVDVRAKSVTLDDVGSAPAVKPCHLLRLLGYRVKAFLADDERPAVEAHFDELHVGYMRSSVGRLLSWSLPEPIRNFATAESMLGRVELGIGTAVATLHEPAGSAAFTATLRSSTVALSMQKGEPQGTIGSASLQEHGIDGVDELFATMVDSTGPLLRFEKLNDAGSSGGGGVGQPAFYTPGGAHSPRTAGGIRRPKLFARVQPFALTGRLRSVRRLRALATAEMGFVRRAAAAAFAAPVAVAPPAAGRGRAPTCGMQETSEAEGGDERWHAPMALDVEVHGASARLLLDDADDIGVQASVERLVLGPSAPSSGSSSTPPSPSASPLARPAPPARCRDSPPRPSRAARGAEGTAGGDGEPLQLRVLELEVHALGAEYEPADGAPMVHEASLDVLVERSAGGRVWSAVARGDTLLCDLTEEQLQLARRIAAQPDDEALLVSSTMHATPPPPPPRGDDRLPPPAGSGSPPAEPQVLGFNLGFNLGLLTLNLRSARGCGASYTLHGIELRTERAPSRTTLRAAVGRWRTNGRLAAPRRRASTLAGEAGGSRLDRKALLDEPPPHADTRAVPRRPLLELEAGSHAGSTRLHVAPCGGCASCGARLSLSSRTCWLYLPLMRLATLLCCCLPAFRSLVLLVLREICAHACSVWAWCRCCRRSHPSTRVKVRAADGSGRGHIEMQQMSAVPQGLSILSSERL